MFRGPFAQRTFIAAGLLLIGPLVALGILIDQVWLRNVVWPVRYAVLLGPVALESLLALGLAVRVLQGQGARLRSAEDRLRAVLEAAPAAIVITRRDGSIVTTNAQVAKLLGYSPEELLGKPIKLLLPDSSQKLDSANRQSAAPGGTGTDLIARRKNGSEIPVEVRLNLLETEDEPLLLHGLRDASKRRKTETALHEREAHLQLLMQQMPAIVWTTDTNLQMTYSVGAGLAELNLKPEQVMGLSLLEHLETDDIEATPVAAHQRALQGESRSHEMHWRGKTFQVRVEPLRGHDGKTITGTIGVVLDITAQKQTLAQLKARIRQQEVVADLGRHALTGTDLGALLDEAAVLVAHTLEVEFSGVWKLQAEENALLLRAGVGWRDGSVGHSRLPVGSRSPISLTLQRYEPVLVEDLSVDQRFPGAGVLHEHGINGSVSIPVQGKERPFGVLSAHSATGRTFTAEDVHFLQAIANVLAAAIERQLAEQELRRSEAKNQAILKALPDLIFRLNRTGEFLNGKASEATDWPVAPAHIAGQKLRGVLPVEVADQWQQNLIKALETGAMQAFEFQLARPRGVHDYEARFVPSGDGDILAVVRDVTERKRLEEQLRQAQKTEAIGRLAGGVAHDFNNLLTAILGYSELLLLDLVPGHPMHEGLAEIKKAAERAAALTRQLLAFSRKQVIAPQILDLNAILGDMGKMLGRLIGENIELVTSPAPAPAPVKADPNQLQQVLMNLAVNARDAMPRGGRLTLTIALVTLDETFAQRHLEVKPGPYVLLQVSDTGCGMSEEVRRHIFEPFFTTKGLGLGTGLGLSTVYGIIKQNGGHVEVASEPDQGTMFRIYLPRSSELVGGAELEGLAAPVPGGRETVLVVEDEEVVRALVRTLLGQQGYTILEAANGEEALRVAGRHSGPIHLLLTDVIMPGMSGREAAQRLTARYPDLRVLYLSGYTDDALGEHGILEPDIDFLHKPFNQNSLIRKVRELLDANRSPQLRPSLASEI